MDEIIQRTIEAYTRINPRDRQDTEAHMRQETLDHLLKSVGSKIDPATALIMNTTLLGFTVRIDDTLPFGKVDFVTENAQERALRRLARDYTINVMKLEVSSPEMIMRQTPPTLTLRALLRKWFRQAQR